jgi:hypothetical protein
VVQVLEQLELLEKPAISGRWGLSFSGAPPVRLEVFLAGM